MRPLRLEIEGFSAYRERVEVDFTGVDFFTLTGPTGAGKSSLVDAMVFALFGRVPRLGGNAVAPAITAGADRARVRLDFEVEGERHTAVRMAQRTSSGGATVREARLLRGETVLAGSADEVTTAVEELLRLRFEDFTRTVVLPQGDFARFLTAPKSERQGLLRALLGLDVYTRVRELAKTRAAVAGERAEAASRSLQVLAIPGEGQVSEAVERRDRLAELSVTIVDREKALAGLDAAVGDAVTAEMVVGEAIARLEAIGAPENLDRLDTLFGDARTRLVDLTDALAGARASLAAAEAARSELPTSERLAMWGKARERLSTLDARLTESSAGGHAENAQAADQAHADAAAALAGARSAVGAARGRHAAHQLSRGLHVGAPCPVCAREVDVLPDHPEPAGLVELEAEESRLTAVVEDLRNGAEAARSFLAASEAARSELTAARDAVLVDLTDAPAEEEMGRITAELTGLEADLARNREEVEALEVEEKRSRLALEDLADASRRVAKLLTSAQMRVADLEPPVSESDDVVVQWKELIEWRAVTLAGLAGRREEAMATVAAATVAATDSRALLEQELARHGLEPVEPYAVEVATALQTWRATVESHEKALRDAASLRAQAEESGALAAVAEALAGHLKANGFEQWLMAGAIIDLVAGANELLGQLSAGGYSLHSDDAGTFAIVDHRNADEMRSVATLSGGETFLVSLALALSLAETLAAKGGSGLDAIILDEGFGTLDDESLDTVAAVLEELAGRGLMVGVITHVKELAARAPVRYEVTREPGGAKVRLVS